MLSIKEWAAEYRRINTAEWEELKQRLPKESAEHSLRSYLSLCEFLVRLSPDAQEAFAEQRRQHYLALEARIRKAAERWGCVIPS